MATTYRQNQRIRAHRSREAIRTPLRAIMTRGGSGGGGLGSTVAITSIAATGTDGITVHFADTLAQAIDYDDLAAILTLENGIRPVANGPSGGRVGDSFIDLITLDFNIVGDDWSNTASTSIRFAGGGTLAASNGTLTGSYDPAVKPTSPVFNSGHSLATGMIAAYLLNEGTGTSLADSTSNLAAATLSNGAWVSDSPGAAINFTNANSKITLPNISAQFGSNQASILLVVKLLNDTPVSTQKAGLLFVGGGIFDTYYPYDGDGLIYDNTFHSTRVVNIDDGAFNKAAWHKWSVSAKNGAGNRRMFQNGVLLDAAAGEATITVGATSTIGKSQSDVWLDGRIATVMLWNRALTDLEMAALNTDAWAMFR